MSFIGDAIGDVFGGITGAKQAARAGERAGDIQAASANAGVEEQRRQFDALIDLMFPYVEAGNKALSGQQSLIGLQGPDAQRQIIGALEASPEFASLVQQGETSILQNASATGGLRGGNIQAALAQFRPQVLSALINQQYGRLGGLSALGQASAAGQAAAGMETGVNVANLLQQRGAAQAGGLLAAGSVPRQTFGDALKVAGIASGVKKF